MTRTRMYILLQALSAMAAETSSVGGALASPLRDGEEAWRRVAAAAAGRSRTTTTEEFLRCIPDQTCLLCNRRVVLFPTKDDPSAAEEQDVTDDTGDGEVAWSGSPMGLPAMFLCEGCVQKGLRSRALPIPPNCFVCDFQMWEMFREENGAATCAPFDLREGWHRDVPRNEDLCCHHAQRLLVSTDPKHADWKAAFTKRYSVADLVRFADTDDFASRKRTLICCRSGARVGVEPVALQPPPGDLSADDLRALVEAATRCVFHPSRDAEESEEDHGRVAEAAWTFPMEDLALPGQQAAISGEMPWTTSAAEPWLVRDEAFRNLAEWLPFDADSSERFALVNCLGSSSRFGKVAIYHAPHLTLADFTLPDYLAAKRAFDARPVVQLGTVVCDECDERGYPGDSWLCHPEEYDDMWAYEICAGCLSASGSSEAGEPALPHQHGTDCCDLPLTRRPRASFLQTLS
jgi:hypothetical protein